MTQMNLAAEQKRARGHREQPCVARGARSGRDGEGGWRKAEVIIIYRREEKRKKGVMSAQISRVIENM